MNCCVRCFVDKKVASFVRKHGKTGNCDFCRSRKLRVLPASELHDLFEPLLSLFEPLAYGEHFHKEFRPDPSEIGETLPNCIEWKQGWQVFNDSLDDKVKCRLLDEIRQLSGRRDEGEGGETLSSAFWATEEDRLFHTSEEEIWQEFAEGIKWSRRFIPASGNGTLSDPKSWLPQYLNKIALFVSPDKSFHRARLGGLEESYVVQTPFPAAQMSIPPRTKATAGRANPVGIPYLYVAEKEMTAVCEIRPFLGGLITVATVKPRQNLQLVDLTKVRSIESPFGYPNLRMEMEQNALLGILNRELSKPVNPALAEIEYVPTQYLAEVILDAGYDGIRYKSAMHSGGFNIVFFDAEKLEVQSKTKLVKVTANTLEYSPPVSSRRQKRAKYFHEPEDDATE